VPRAYLAAGSLATAGHKLEISETTAKHQRSLVIRAQHGYHEALTKLVATRGRRPER
jgi:hypothetical protein